jgi:hypothetical protein
VEEDRFLNPQNSIRRELFLLRNSERTVYSTSFDGSFELVATSDDDRNDLASSSLIWQVCRRWKILVVRVPGCSWRFE